MSQQMIDVKSESQLQVLHEINEICKRLHARCWLRGGWAIDFMLGRITRPHEDLDLVTWARHREKLEKALMEAGYERIPVSKRQTDFRKGDVDIQFCYLTRDHNGSLIPDGLPEWVWRPDSLPLKHFSLYGISICALSPHQLLEEKVVYEQIGRTPRAKDMESKKLLQNLIEQSMKP
ncbi:nucleotidyltransferase domain-containing protein [Paenibacillus sp. KN14-4R]|uniref:nucleotidyltransferase domain-containing protein n=1 Tax=Paenibacillus sp. KN14-4R TaxID=3445773 RepID=UPI003F9F9CF1